VAYQDWRINRTKPTGRNARPGQVMAR